MTKQSSFQKRVADDLAKEIERWRRLQRRDGIDPRNAWFICGECNDLWNFPDLDPGDYCLLPCQHGFLLRDEKAAGKAEFYGPGADYRVTMEPPE